LDHPLSSFAAKRVEKKRKNPLYTRSGERSDERSDVGVSRFYDVMWEGTKKYAKAKPRAISSLGKGRKGFLWIASLHWAYKPLPATTQSSRSPPVGRELKNIQKPGLV